MAFQQGLSGLGAASRALDVISSNVANSSTVGFKASSTVFADTFAAAMGGGVSNLQVGMGGNTLAVRQSFTQGATTSTNNPLDLAIGGNGFFQIERINGSTAYSRNGQFDLNKDGYIVTPLGERLMGYQTVNADGTVGYIGSTTPRPLLVPPNGIGAKPTGGGDLNLDGEPDGDAVAVRGNLDSASIAPTVAFDQTNPSSYNFTTSAAVYDSLGNQHSVSMFFVKKTAIPDEPLTTTVNEAQPNPWDVYITFDGKELADPNSPSTYTIDPSNPRPYAADGSTRIGFNSSFGGFDPANSAGNPIRISVSSATLGTGSDPLLFDLDLSNFTQRRSASAVFEISQDGSPPGELASVSVSSDGIVQGRYTNGETRDLGKIILGTFRNPNGLASVGDNLWAETIDSGQAALAGPGDGLNGTIGSGRVEESNVDMSQELVNMIIQQRNYQANAQSIKTQDQILQTLINLR
jgi:flagellar hook protein FlgE